MHGRLQAARPGQQTRGEAITWTERVLETVRPETWHLGLDLAEAIDVKGQSMARELADVPEPWVLNTLGPFPADGSSALQADWLARIGDAAGYRQAADVTDPNMVLGPAPQGHPELLNWHTRVLGKLEIETEERMIWAMTRGQLEATVAAGERMKTTAPPEVSPELKAERLAEADTRARGAELAALGDHQAAHEAQARADAADVRATALEGRAEVYAQWEADTAAERRSTELARSELEARAQTAERAGSKVEAETATAAQSTEVPDPTDTTSDLVEPDRDRKLGAGIEDPEATAGALVAELDQVELPETDTSSPIEDPELAAMADELAARSQAREATAEARQQGAAEIQADRAQRAAMREAAARDAEARAPEASVSGPRTPSWGGPEASTPETTPAAEAEATL